jgi:hypothetical protein
LLYYGNYSVDKCNEQTPHVRFIFQQFVSGEHIEELFNREKLNQYPFETDGIVLMPLKEPYHLGNSSNFHQVTFFVM